MIPWAVSRYVLTGGGKNIHKFATEMNLSLQFLSVSDKTCHPPPRNFMALFVPSVKLKYGRGRGMVIPNLTEIAFARSCKSSPLLNALESVAPMNQQASSPNRSRRGEAIVF